MQDNPTIRRLIVTLATAALVVLNRKLGLGLETQELVVLAGLAAAYVLQSGHVAATKARAEGELAAAHVAETKAKAEPGVSE